MQKLPALVLTTIASGKATAVLREHRDLAARVLVEAKTGQPKSRKLGDVQKGNGERNVRNGYTEA